MDVGLYKSSVLAYCGSWHAAPAGTLSSQGPFLMLLISLAQRGVCLYLQPGFLLVLEVLMYYSSTISSCCFKVFFSFINVNSDEKIFY